MIKFDFSTYNSLDINNYDLTNELNKFKLENKMAGWYKLDTNLSEIEKYAKEIRDKADIFIVIGIGGSYLGAQAVIEALTPYFNRNKPEVIYLGTSLSSDYMYDLIKYVKDKNIYVNVISKSGNTLETIISFEYLLDYMKKTYNDFCDRIVVTTNSNSGKLLEYSKKYNFKTFNVPDDIGGRYSVLSNVGLLPIAVEGIDIYKLMEGAKNAKENLDNIYKYTYIRNEMIKENKYVESFDVYEPKLFYFTEWLKQLFAESQGKCENSILPVSTVNSRDLHSLGQYYQEGRSMIFSTIIFSHSEKNIFVEKYEKNLDQINKIVMDSVVKAHYPHINTNIIELDKIDEVNVGYLLFFFEMSAMLGCYMLDINYYDQPGVNLYKDNLNKYLKD